MTAIAAYKDGDTYWIASDSCAVGSGTKQNRGSKLIKKGNYYIGFTWSYRTADIIAESKKLPKEINSIRDIRKFRDILYEELVEKGHAKTEAANGDNISHPVGLIFITKIGIFEIESDYQIAKHKYFAATGSGWSVCLGSLYNSYKTKQEGKLAVTLAIKAAINLTTYVGGDVYIASVKKG